MEKKTLALIFKSIIWVCLAVIIFSPLYVASNLFFPFITTKTFAFQIAVEVMLSAFLLLCLVDEKYRIHTNLTVILIATYLVILIIASAFSGNDFYHSFWSNNEREDGILLLGHLFLFSIVLTGFFRSLKEWLYLFDMFLVASFCVAIVSLDQYLALGFPGIWQDHFMPSSNGARLAATIGNAGYVGGYMVFGVFVSLFMVLKRPQIWLKVWYIFLLVLELFIAVQTQTRGAYLALGLGGLISAVYLMWFYWQDKYLKIALITLLVAGALGLTGIFVFKDSNLIKNQAILSRVSSISLTAATANNRMVTWGIGFQGFKERPLLGYGQENFYQVFDRYYSTKNTEQWFDRCHNMVCDRAITGGIFGLLGYLALLLLPFYALWVYYVKEYGKKQENQENVSRKYLIPIVFSILIVAYVIQNMFIFEALATYVPLIIVLSFVGIYSSRWDLDFWDNRYFKTISAVVALVLLIPALWIFNLEPYSANRDFIKILASGQDVSLADRIDAFEEVIARDTYGNQEYRRHYFSVFEGVLSEYISNFDKRTEANDRLVANFSKKMEAQFNNQISDNSYSISNYLLLIRFYNLSYIFDVTRLQKSIDLADKVIALSPGRPQVYYEIATSHYYLGNYNLSLKKEAEAKEQFRLSLDWFYDGARQNVDTTQSLGQLLSFMSAVSSNATGETVGQAFVADGGVYPVTDITKQMIDWAYESSKTQTPEDYVSIKNQLKNIIEWLIKFDPKNTTLQSQLEMVR